MNLKKQISKFRSQILIGEYQSAISISKSIMTQIQVLMELKIIKDDRLYNYIQQEYEKCLSLKNFIHNKIRSTEEPGVKKWGNKQASKWKKKQQLVKIEAPQYQPLKESQKQPTSPIKQITNERYIELLQKIERQIMMPIKMPSFFKAQPNYFKLVVVNEQDYGNLLTYFLENEFMSIEYQAFQYQFSKSPQLNYFYENNISQILIDCKYMNRQQIVLSKEKRKIKESASTNCVFISISHHDSHIIV